MHPKNISIKDFTYLLPEDRIALFPLAERDSSKLLVYQGGEIRQDVYSNIAAHLPAHSLLVFNNTKVIPARILFQKPTGGVIEIFCLEPHEDGVNEFNLIMNTTGKLRWKCMIGGASKWKDGPLVKQIQGGDSTFTIEARLTEKLTDAYVVELSWQPAHHSFAEILGLFGDIPLPPYIKRKAAATDKDRYQTIYAKYQGSVAAPTAGLHFTDHIFTTLQEKKISKAYVTLHVGAGTFKPVKATSMQGHEMHSEWIDVNVAAIETLVQHAGEMIVAVGTTSLRTIESLYWMGVKTILQPEITINELPICQWEVYEPPLAGSKYELKTALTALLHWMQRNGMERLLASTQILIAPGYQYKVARAIVTNFHQPQSTLLLLVAAAVKDWRQLYAYALENDFRFLSYGDGSLVFTDQQ
jgi:S-adenosylmethionine:tRNA ribosyltransferase-isomerase